MASWADRYNREEEFLDNAMQEFLEARQKACAAATPAPGPDSGASTVTDATTRGTNAFMMSLAQDFRCGSLFGPGNENDPMTARASCYCAKLRAAATYEDFAEGSVTAPIAKEYRAVMAAVEARLKAHDYGQGKAYAYVAYGHE